MDCRCKRVRRGTLRDVVDPVSWYVVIRHSPERVEAIKFHSNSKAWKVEVIER